MIYYLSQVLNGLSFGMLLFLLAAGLTLTLGVMRIINLTHGSFYLVGAYIALDIGRSTGNFLIATLLGGVAGLVMGAVAYPLFRLVGTDPIRQSLLAFGLIFVAADLALVRWGGNPSLVNKPEWFTGAFQLGPLSYPSYRLFLIAVGIVAVLVLQWMERRTLVGAMIRAVTDDPEMAGGVGLSGRVIGAGAFLGGALLAGAAGSLGGALVGVYPGADIQVLLFALLVVIIGGMGSIGGSFVAAVVVGLLDTFGRVFIPELGAALMFILMLAILVIRPTGLFGREV